MPDHPPCIQDSSNLRDVLLEFAISYLLERSNRDVVDCAVDFFTKLQKNRREAIIHGNQHAASLDESVISDEEERTRRAFNTRRKSVSAERYNPESDSEEESRAPIVSKSDEQRIHLLESIKNILFFRTLDAEQMSQVLDAMFERTVGVDEIIINQGDDGDNFYVIESGKYRAYVNDKLINTYDNYGSFGELALLYNMPRSATIKSETAGKLWVMDRQAFRRIVLKSTFRKRKMYESLLDSVPMLKALQDYERMNLADALIPKIYCKNERIIKQGDDADGMYFIEEGTVSIRLEQDGGEVELSLLGKGEYFGELALLTHIPRAVSAYANEDLKVAYLDVEAFERLLGPCMDIMQRQIGDYKNLLSKFLGSKGH